MQCGDCGNEVALGAYFCGSCGRPMGTVRVVTTAEETAPPDVPAPAPPRERPTAGPLSGAVPRTGKALCSLCMGSFPETVLARVDGRAYCPDCSPVSGRAWRPDPGAPAGGGGDRPGDRGGVSGGLPPIAPAPRPFAPAAPSRVLPGAAIAAAALLLVAGGAFAVFSLTGGGRVASMLGDVDDSPRPPRLLAYKYNAGEAFTYHLKMRVKGDMEASGGFGTPGAVEADVTVFADLPTRVLAVDPDGNADLEMTITGFDVTGEVLVDGRSLPVDLSQLAAGMGGGMPEMGSFRMRLDPLGRPVEGMEGEGTPFPGLNLMSDSPLGGALPDRALKPGDEWSSRETFDLPMANGVNLPATSVLAEYRVEGYRKIVGRDCMVISMKGGMDGMDGDLGMGFKMSCDFDFEGAVFFDVEAGRLVKAAMDVRIDLNMGGQGATIAADGVVEIDMEIR